MPYYIAFGLGKKLFGIPILSVKILNPVDIYAEQIQINEKLRVIKLKEFLFGSNESDEAVSEIHLPVLVELVNDSGQSGDLVILADYVIGIVRILPEDILPCDKSYIKNNKYKNIISGQAMITLEAQTSGRIETAIEILYMPEILKSV